MRKLASWGRNNPRKARIVIIVLHLVLGLLAYALAILIKPSVYHQDILLYSSIILFILVCLLYPNNSGFKPKWEFGFSKLCHFLIASCSFIAVFCLDSKIFNPAPITQYVQASSNAIVKPKPKQQTAQEILSSLKYRDKSTLTPKEKRILRKELKKQVKTYAIQTVKGKKADATSTALIIVTIIGALGLLSLVSALACELSCNGMESASTAVLIVGIVAVIFLVILIVRSINRGAKRRIQRRHEAALKESET